jgi:hypothetical protein
VACFNEDKKNMQKSLVSVTLETGRSKAKWRAEMVAELPGKATPTGSRLTVLLRQIFLFQFIANLALDYILRKK